MGEWSTFWRAQHAQSLVEQGQRWGATNERWKVV